jgi:hypothetical protein
MWWESDDSDRDEFVHIDRISQIIEDQRTYLGTMRSVRVPTPPVEMFGGGEQDIPNGIPAPVDPNAPVVTPPDPYKQTQQYADMLEKMCLDLWREWSMTRQYSMMGFYSVILGSAIGVLEFSADRGIPVFRVRSPQGFYAVARSDDDTRLKQAIFAQYVVGASLALEYPQCVDLADTDKVLVIDYFDEKTRMKLAENVELPLISVPNPLGRVPAYIFPNLLVPGIYGTTMIPRGIPIQNELDRLFTQEAEMTTEALNAPTVISTDSPDIIPEGWTWAKGSLAKISANGRVGKASMDVLDHAMFEGRINMMLQMLDATMDFSSVSRGEFSGSVLTGKGVNGLLGSGAARMDAKMQVMNEVMSRVMEDALLMWSGKAAKVKTPGKYAKPAFGIKNKSAFSFTADPKNINPDWVKVDVFVDSASMVDQQAAEVTTLQKVRGTPQLMSVETALELDNSIRDVGEEQRRMDDEAAKRAAAQAAIMQATGQYQPAPTITSAEENYSAERGGAVPGAPTPGAPPAAGPSGGPGSAPETPGPGPDLSGNLNAAMGVFQQIPNIHGAVYLEGLSATGDFSEGIKVYVADPTDKATIANFFANDAELKAIHDTMGIKWSTTLTSDAVQVAGPQDSSPDSHLVPPGPDDQSSPQAPPSGIIPGPAQGGPHPGGGLNGL